MKNKKKLVLLILILMLAMWITSVMAQSDEAGDSTVTVPAPDNIETVAVVRLPSGVTQVTAYIYADRVSFISSGNASTNYGSWADVYFGNQPGGYGAMRPFLHFPVEQLPSSANITSSHFKLYLKSVEDTQNRQYNAYSLSSGWGESSITWNNRPGRSGTVAWNANMNNAIGWHSTNATNLTRNWHSNPGGNHGIEIEGEEGSNVHTRVYSSNRSLNAPYLEVQYTTNTNPPAAWVTTISPYVNVSGTNWTSSHFNIQWTATDYSGTGIKWYDMYYTHNNGSNWTIGQAQVTHTSTQFGPLTHGTTYGFYVRARDNTNLEGAAPSGSGSIQKTVRIDGVAPNVAIHDLPEHSGGSGETLNWSGADDGSGIQNYDVQWRVAGGTWVDLITTTATSYDVSGGTHGTTYEFRARGRDRVGNVPDWSSVHTTSTTVWLEPTAYILSFNDSVTNDPIHIYSKDPVGPENGDQFKVLWAGDAAPGTSIVSFSLRYQKPGNPTWFAWHTEVISTSANFEMTDDTNVFPEGIYTFQAKAKDSAGTEGDYHEETQGTIVVDREAPWMTDNQIYMPIIMKP